MSGAYCRTGVPDREHRLPIIDIVYKVVSV